MNPEDLSALAAVAGDHDDGVRRDVPWRARSAARLLGPFAARGRPSTVPGIGIPGVGGRNYAPGETPARGRIVRALLSSLSAAGRSFGRRGGRYGRLLALAHERHGDDQPAAQPPGTGARR